MKYNFYGWKTATVPPMNETYKGITTPQKLYDALTHIWCRYTCAPRLRDEWSKENYTMGQCSITAFLVQDIFGGDVYGIKRPGGNYHCFNNVNGVVFDLTSEMFGDEVLDYDDCELQSREEHFSKEEKKLRYEFLVAELTKYTEGHIPTGLPGGLYKDTESDTGSDHVRGKKT